MRIPRRRGFGRRQSEQVLDGHGVHPLVSPLLDAARTPAPTDPAAEVYVSAAYADADPARAGGRSAARGPGRRDRRAVVGGGTLVRALALGAAGLTVGGVAIAASVAVLPAPAPTGSAAVVVEAAAPTATAPAGAPVRPPTPPVRTQAPTPRTATSAPSPVTPGRIAALCTLWASTPPGGRAGLLAGPARDLARAAGGAAAVPGRCGPLLRTPETAAPPRRSPSPPPPSPGTTTRTTRSAGGTTTTTVTTTVVRNGDGVTVTRRTKTVVRRGSSTSVSIRVTSTTRRSP